VGLLVPDIPADRLTCSARSAGDSGSIFVQIGDENIHLVRTLLDEVFGDRNFVSLISFQTTTGFEAKYLGNMSDLWSGMTRTRTRSIEHPVLSEAVRTG